MTTTPPTHPRLRTAHAYTPRETGSYGGSQHIVTRDAFKSGRLRREPGDALCKPYRKFWGLSAHATGAPTCQRCIEIAQARDWTTIEVDNLRMVEGMLESAQRAEDKDPRARGRYDRAMAEHARSLRGFTFIHEGGAVVVADHFRAAP